MTKIIIAVATGGAIGAVLRYVTGVIMGGLIHSRFPFDTMLVNIIGSCLMGMAVAYFMNQLDSYPFLKPFITIGLLGGLTTFSTFSLNLYDLINKEEFIQALFYGLGSVILSFLALILGLYIMRG